MEVFCPGFDTLINFHLGLASLLSTSVPQYDDLSVPTSTENQYHQQRYHCATYPGSGAFTPYFNGTSKVNAKDVVVPPYSEWFKDYGDHWFEDRIDTFGHIPLSSDYDAIFQVLQKFAALRKVIPLSSSSAATAPEHSNPFLEDLYKLVLLHWKDQYDSRTLNALPPTFHDAMSIGIGTSRAAMTNYLLQQHTTSLEYLQEYGTCIDQIHPERLTLSNAGHGGFATRPFPEGTVITASPLLIIPHERVLYMYNFTKYNHQWYRNYKKKKHYQLIYNYCYGHPDSTVLLCPHGGGINYINHNQSMANVKLEWATTQLSYVHNKTLVQNGTVEELTQLASLQQGSQLVFQYVATQDIQPKDKLFLDYGSEWDAAWHNHVARYPCSHSKSSGLETDVSTNQHPPVSPKYVSAHEYNYYHSDDIIRTMEEQLVKLYPSNLQLRCH